MLLTKNTRKKSVVSGSAAIRTENRCQTMKEAEAPTSMPQEERSATSERRPTAARTSPRFTSQDSATTAGTSQAPVAPPVSLRQ